MASLKRPITGPVIGREEWNTMARRRPKARISGARRQQLNAESAEQQTEPEQAAPEPEQKPAAPEPEQKAPVRKPARKS